jgi:chromosome partitioning protein
MRTVLVANRKGGVGKTMVSVTIATALAARGLSVALADADPQKSALRWLKLRPDSAATIRAVDWTDDKDFGDAPKRVDWLVIDAPGAIAGERAERLIAESEAVIAPVLPAAFDIDSTRRFLKEIEHIKRVRKGKVAVHLIANRVKPGRTIERLAADFEKLGHVPVAWIAERTAYADLAAQGLSVFDRPQKAYMAMRQQWAPVVDLIAQD